jgi:hypothetical protein
LKAKIARDIGPSLDLIYRRSNFANDDNFKKACKQPKAKKDKRVNCYYLEENNRRKTFPLILWEKREDDFMVRGKTLMPWFSRREK